MKEYKGTLSDAQIKIIIDEYYKAEKTYKRIGSELGINYNTIRTFIRNRIQKGELEPVNRRRIRKELNSTYREVKKIDVPKVTHKTNPDVDVNCNKVWEHCKYGCSNSGHCNFQSIVGRSRIFTSPNPTHCHDYVKGKNLKQEVMF